MAGVSARSLALVIAAACAALASVPACALGFSRDARFTADDGVSLQTTISGSGSLAPRPTIVEFSPYGRNSGTLDAGAAFNHLLVQIRGTGDSDGQFDALGPRTQRDVVQVLRWACHQPWSNGTLGLNGFSASAITVYNSLHLRLPCVKAAVMKSGTYELYRDLLSPGGISNAAPGLGVLALIGAPALEQGGDRLGRDPLSGADTFQGLLNAGLSDLQHPTLDSWWRERGFRGDVNHVPILMIDGFFDVESRGAFQAFQRLRRDGAHLIVVGAHDGAPAGTDGGVGASRRWLAHYLLGERNGVRSQPRVKLWMSNGDREDFLGGKFTRYTGRDWPIPRTRWQPLALGAGGTLSLKRPSASATQSYPALPSPPSSTDPPNTAIVGAAGFNALTTALPVLTDMTLAEPLGLSYTTPVLSSDVLAAGPASLELRLSSTAPQTNIWAVISDVSPDGVAHPLTAGRLSSDYPSVNRAKSLDVRGQIVQPYGKYDSKSPAPVGQERLYRVEFWPIGNKFARGHRIRLTILGSSAASTPSAPAVNSVSVGGPHGSRLLFPVLPVSNLARALGQKR